MNMDQKIEMVIASVKARQNELDRGMTLMRELDQKLVKSNISMPIGLVLFCFHLLTICEALELDPVRTVEIYKQPSRPTKDKDN